MVIMCFGRRKDLKSDTEFVAVCHDAEDGSFYFEVISKEEYDNAASGHWTESVEAVFAVSNKPFDQTENVGWEYGYAAVLYISDILVNPAVCEIVCDILHDFMVINGLERGKDAIRVQLAADSLLASSLAGEDDYRLAGHIGDIVYYEADTKSFC